MGSGAGGWTGAAQAASAIRKAIVAKRVGRRMGKYWGPDRTLACTIAGSAQDMNLRCARTDMTMPNPANNDTAEVPP